MGGYFTPCSDLGGCDNGTLVASPATYGKYCRLALCGTTCREHSKLGLPCLALAITTANTTAGYDTTTREGFTCAQNDAGLDFACSGHAPQAHLLLESCPLREGACDLGLCSDNADAADDHLRAGKPQPPAVTVGADDLGIF